MYHAAYRVVAIVLPYLAGAIGAYLLTEYPAVHQAVCSGGV